MIETEIELDYLDAEFMDFSDADIELMDSYLDENDFSMEQGDLEALSSDMELGWDAVDSDTGLMIEDQLLDNFDSVPYDQGFEINTFEDYSMDDFGGGFDDMGMDFDW